jgi:hypothetical protein
MSNKTGKLFHYDLTHQASNNRTHVKIFAVK